MRDGLLSSRLDRFNNDPMSRRMIASMMREGFTIGRALARILAHMAPQLEDDGRYAEWRRARDKYVSNAESFLASLDDDKRQAMKRRPPSHKQLALARYTCACLQVGLPELPDRWAAFEWLRDTGANPRYRELRR